MTPEPCAEHCFLLAGVTGNKPFTLVRRLYRSYLNYTTTEAMMVSISQNNVVLEPRKQLTRSQQDAVKAIAFFRRQKKTNGRWLVGDKQISGQVILDLERLDLVDEKLVQGQSLLKLTTIGSLVAERLQH